MSKEFQRSECRRITDLEEVKRIPLTPPNVDRATKIGIIHDMTPYMRWANVYNQTLRLIGHREKTKNKSSSFGDDSF